MKNREPVDSTIQVMLNNLALVQKFVNAGDVYNAKRQLRFIRTLAVQACNYVDAIVDNEEEVE